MDIRRDLTLLALCLSASACVSIGPTEPQELTCWIDGDGDGFGYPGSDFLYVGFSCDEHPGAARRAGDCHDADPDRNPAALEIADDGVDSDCSGHDLVTCWIDRDLDGFGVDPFEVEAPDCVASRRRTDEGGDCDDEDEARHPYAQDVPEDGVDQDCNGFDSVPCFYDGDGDGFGHPQELVTSDGLCGDDGDEATNGDDCDDSRPERNPLAYEICNGADDDCDGIEDVPGLHAVAVGGDAWARLTVPAVAWGTFTLELRVGLSSGAGPLLVKRNPQGVEELRIESDGQQWWLLLAGNDPLPGPPVAEDGQQLALVSDGPRLLWFDDGQEFAAWTGVQPSSWAVSGFLGLLGDPESRDGASLPASIDEVRVWSVPRSADDLLASTCATIEDDPLGNLRVHLRLDGDWLDSTQFGWNATPFGDWEFREWNSE